MIKQYVELHTYESANKRAHGLNKYSPEDKWFEVKKGNKEGVYVVQAFQEAEDGSDTYLYTI